MNFLSLLILPLLPIQGFSQGKNANEILDKSIQYHDPGGQWNSFNYTLEFTSERPDAADRKSTVTINNNTGLFRLREVNNNMEILMDACQEIPEGKTCDQVKRTRNYYLYLWGLPMKLKDKGTPLESEVNEERFDNFDCYVLRVPYEQDTWYFYIDKLNYRLRGYMFYKDESKKEGEVIRLKDEAVVGKMKLPKERSWYTLPDEKYLGTDILVSSHE